LQITFLLVSCIKYLLLTMIKTLILYKNFNQLAKIHYRKKKIHKTRTRALIGKPQIRGTCLRVVTRTPRKPNSALRHVAKIKLCTGKKAYAYLPGEGNNNLQPHSVVLLQGGRLRDVPAINYRLIRGKLDFMGVKDRKTSRSRYGAKKPENSK